jgi:GNAT superfamily N-acetyltransferase
MRNPSITAVSVIDSTPLSASRHPTRPVAESRIIDVWVFGRDHGIYWGGSLLVSNPARPHGSDRHSPAALRLRQPGQTARALAARVRWRARLWRHIRLLADRLRLEIRPCTSGDLQLLERRLPTDSARQLEQAFALPQTGRGDLLVAWLWGEPVGHLLVTWTEPDDPPLPRSVPTAARIGAIGVVAPVRCHGIGTALVTAAEILAGRRGHQAVEAAVRTDNRPARALFLRMGYADVGRPSTRLWSGPDVASQTTEGGGGDGYLRKWLPPPTTCTADGSRLRFLPTTTSVR